MDTDRKRPVTSREPDNMAQDAVPEEGKAAQPPDERASSSPSAPKVSRKASRRSKQPPEVTRPMSLVRLQTKPRQPARVSLTGTPDWSLSVGVATVLFGFAVAFGTYVTLTQREAVQSRLRQHANQDEQRTVPRHVPIPIPTPMTEPALAIAVPPRGHIETPQVSLAAQDDAMLATASSSGAASAPSRVIARSTPVPPATSPAAPTPTPTNPASKQAAANPVPPSNRQAAKNNLQDTSKTLTATRATATAPKERKVSTKPAKAEEFIAQKERAPHEPVITPPLAKVTATTAVLRDEPAAASPATARPTASAPAHANVQTEAATTSLQSFVNRELFRQH